MEQIATVLQEKPHLTPKEVAELVGTKRGWVYQVMRKRDMPCSPLNRRLCRVEERLKAVEASLLKVLTVKGLADRKSEFGL